MTFVTLSHFQTTSLLKARRAGETTVTTSADLNLSSVEVQLDAEGVVFPNGVRLTWKQAEEITESENGCFRLEDGELEKIQMFSDVTNRHCSLMPTKRAPTLLIAGFPMHRIKDVTPDQDTVNKIQAARPRGRVLDTNTGLGYTAIEASKLAESVTTIELDPAVIEVARQNPWSRGLFENSKITQVVGDSFDVVEEMDDGLYDVIVHDPPTLSLAGHLYSEDFYYELHRILKPKGSVFHYIGDPSSKLGFRTTRGATERLLKVGFRKVLPMPKAFGVVAMV